MDLRDFFSGPNWWGKFIGAFFGYLIAGPAGALFGILIGNFFDRGLTEHFQNPHWDFHTEKSKTIQKLFFETTFLILGYVSKADGRISQQEIDFANLLMKELGLKKEQKELAKQLFNQGKQPEFAVAPILNEFYAKTRHNPSLLKLFVDIQYKAAAADELTDTKVKALNQVLNRLGFAPLDQQHRFYEDFFFYWTRAGGNPRERRSSQQHSHHRSSHTPPPRGYYAGTDLEKAFSVLNIPSNSNAAEVKRAYRRLMSQNHPDKLIAKGSSEEMIKIANAKTQRIREAYEKICEIKGW